MSPYAAIQATRTGYPTAHAVATIADSPASQRGQKTWEASRKGGGLSRHGRERSPPCPRAPSNSERPGKRTSVSAHFPGPGTLRRSTPYPIQGTSIRRRKEGLGAANNYQFVFPWAGGVWGMGRSAARLPAAFWPSCPRLRAAIGQAGRDDLNVSRETSFMGWRVTFVGGETRWRKFTRLVVCVLVRAWGGGLGNLGEALAISAWVQSSGPGGNDASEALAKTIAIETLPGLSVVILATCCLYHRLQGLAPTKTTGDKGKNFLFYR